VSSCGNKNILSGFGDMTDLTRSRRPYAPRNIPFAARLVQKNARVGRTDRLLTASDLPLVQVRIFELRVCSRTTRSLPCPRTEVLALAERCLIPQRNLTTNCRSMHHHAPTYLSCSTGHRGLRVELEDGMVEGGITPVLPQHAICRVQTAA
jgi:hypothetical protein